jgi:hypothetical protein
MFPFVISVVQRGWTLDVLNIVRRLVESRRRGDETLDRKSPGQPESLSLLTSSPTGEFTNEDVYAFARELEKLHPDNPDNRHRGRNPPAVPQCGILRGTGFLIHVERGCWRLP